MNVLESIKNNEEDFIEYLLKYLIKLILLKKII